MSYREPSPPDDDEDDDDELLDPEWRLWAHDFDERRTALVIIGIVWLVCVAVAKLLVWLNP